MKSYHPMPCLQQVGIKMSLSHRYRNTRVLHNGLNKAPYVTHVLGQGFLVQQFIEDMHFILEHVCRIITATKYRVS